MASRSLATDEMNKMALKHFVYQPVNDGMIAFLAHVTQSVISCDPSSHTRAQLPSSPPKTPEPEHKVYNSLPTVEQFIRQLVVSSNVSVSTLIVSLVYLKRLRARLQPQARGFQCTAHRIFLVSLILASKYLNDLSPKNKHWANYTKICTNDYQFSFSCTEVNTMEKELLSLMEWDLRIHENDLYRELNYFLEPLRQDMVDRQARKTQGRDDKQDQMEAEAVACRYPSPASSRGHSRSRNTSLEHSRSNRSGSTPGLVYSSSASSYVSSTVEMPDVHTLTAAQGRLYDSPVQVYLDNGCHRERSHGNSNDRLPSEIPQEEFAQLHDDGSKKRTRRGVLQGWFAGTVVA